MYKSKNPFEKANYRPVSILPFLPKVYERLMFKQLPNQTKYFLDESGYVGTILMDLSKAYDCIPHQLLIAKLEAYGLHKNSLNLLADYLSGRKQRTKIGSVFSEWWKIICGIPQGSILARFYLIFSLMICFSLS